VERKKLVLACGIVLILGILTTLCSPACGPSQPTPAKPVEPSQPTPAKPVEPSQPTPAKPVELQFNTWVANETHPLYVNILKPWADEVERRTDGRVKTTIHVNQGLASMKTSFDCVVSGVCDITGLTPGHAPERFPLATMPILPLIYTSAEQATRALQDMYDKYPQFLEEEFGQVHVLFTNTNDPTNLLWVDPEPVRTLEDLRGKVVGTYGVEARMLEMLGASPAMITGPETYGMLEKKVIDGLITNWGWIQAGHIDEVTRSYTLVGFMADHLMHIMNKERYESFPPDIRNVIDKVSAPMALKAAQMFDAKAVDTVEWIKTTYPERQFYTLPPDEKERWIERVAPRRDEWVSQVEALGYPGRQMLDDFIAFCKKYEK